MKKVFIVHGLEGKPNGSWRPWIMEELDKQGIYACALPMPTPLHPVCQEWVELIHQNIHQANDSIYLVGHSLGVSAILRYLETLPDNSLIGGAVLVSGTGSTVDINHPHPTVQKVSSFLAKPFNYPLLKTKAKQFAVIHANNDHVVPYSHAQDLSRNLQCELITIPNGGHLNRESGWTKLPEGLDALLNMINS